MQVAEDTKRERIERLVKADPSLSAAEIGRVVVLTRERVRQILDDLGYELDCQWRKRK